MLQGSSSSLWRGPHGKLPSLAVQNLAEFPTDREHHLASYVSVPSWEWIRQFPGELSQLMFNRPEMNCPCWALPKLWIHGLGKKKYVALSYWAWSFVIQQQIIGKQPHPKGSLQPSLQYPGGLRPHVWVWDWGRYAKPKTPSQRFWFNSDQVTLTCSQVILTHLHLEQLEIMRLGFRYLCVIKTP